MPNFTFANVAVNRATCAVDFGGGNVLNVTYLPDKLTTKFLLSMSALESSGEVSADKLSGPVNGLLTLLDSWDAYEDDGNGGQQLLPITFDTLAALPVSTLNVIFKAIAEQQAGEASAPTA